ncbi:MAG: MerR family transcriptional regulator [Acidimicrobiales bacterium]|jgi:DNA-binding transcriptional MerR regulator|nr:MerR family transcriptional regulator [Acidimicrobiales bacterium]
MSERTHVSIGEVLGLLREEFPDITISKIRFLEAQGLVEPERSPSGYRRFAESDVDRLRWVLRQQRENFLPLKVIKDRLDAGEVVPAGGAIEDPSGAAAPMRRSPEVAGRASTVAALQEAPPGAVSAHAGPASATTPAAAPDDLDRAPGAAGDPPVHPASTEPDAAPSAAGRRRVLEHPEGGTSLSLEELGSVTGLTARQIGDLERYGLLAGRTLGGTAYYDDEALLVAQLAASFLARGIEPRHLRMYKVAAEREAGVFEQLLMPLLKQRGGRARREAVEVLDELADMGESMRAAMLRQVLKSYLGRS